MPKARLYFDGDNVYIGKDARIYNLKSDIASKIDGIPGVIDSLDSTSTTDALSANMGRDLQDQINAMSGIGNFLSTWDCTTGLPGTNPQEDPYTYKVGDYYVVSVVGATNYKPHGATYTQGVASQTVETDNVGINDKYYYDGADWVRVPNTAIQITIDNALSTTSTNAVENRVVTNALNGKQAIISDLTTIRSGAALGATALQPNDNISQLTNNVGYQTAGDVAAAIAGKQDILSAGDGISITSNTVTNTKPGAAVSNTAPANPTEGLLWYDTVNDVLKSYDGSNWNEVGSDAADINTKTFYLASSSDLTSAQAAYDWYVAGNNPIIVYDDKSYTLSTITAGGITFESIEVLGDVISNEHTRVGRKTIVLSVTSGSVTSISTQGRTTIANILATNQDYSSPYVPQYNGSPATKKYVDDSVADVVPSGSTAPANPQEGDLWYDTVNHVLKVYNGTSWETVDTDTNTTYTAGYGIEIKNGNDYSAMRGPCAEGFHIPLYSELDGLIQTLTTTLGIAGGALSVCLKMPLSGYRDSNDASVNGVGTIGMYHTSSPSWAQYYYYSMHIDSNGASFYSGGPNQGQSIRPFKDEAVIPDSSWTTLYDGSSVATDAGVFYNATLGLISISGDGVTWTTIADKNLGATVVWDENSLSYSADNCGGYFQWGNCYMFPFSGTVDTTTTAVDVTGYGPGNYYYSDIFHVHYVWFVPNAQVNNLWGGVTGVVTLNNAISVDQSIIATKTYVDTAAGLAASGVVSDAAFSASWDGDTTHAPSKNAVYDVLGDVETLLANL